jgi:hypothetical protein
MTTQFINLDHIYMDDSMLENEIHIDIYRDILIQIVHSCNCFQFASTKVLKSFTPLLTHNDIIISTSHWPLVEKERIGEQLKHTHIKTEKGYRSIKLLSNVFISTWMLLKQIIITDVLSIIQLYIINLTYTDINTSNFIYLDGNKFY